MSKGHRVIKDPKDNRGRMARRVMMVKMAHKGLRVSKGHKDPKGNKGQMVRRVMMVKMAHKDPRGLRGHKGIASYPLTNYQTTRTCS